MTYKTPYILTPAGRDADLMKQGFMKPLPKPRLRKDGKPMGTAKPTVACSAYQNWHPEGRHTQPDATIHRANLAKCREADKRAAMVRLACDTGDWTAFEKAYSDSVLLRRSA
jgi:hypothetical protein